MKQLELGTYVDCSKLTLEQIEKLLKKWTEFVGDDCDDFEEDLSNLSVSDHYLVYCKNYKDEVVMWFWDDSYNAETETFYEDFFPEELEATPETPVKRVKTIDLERKTKEELVEAIFLGQVMGLENFRNTMNSVYSKNFGDSCKISLDGDILNITKTVFAESEEDYQSRIKREKDLNDMYNADISQLKKKLLHAQQDLDDISAVINTAKAMDHQKLEQIKKILEG